MANAVSTAFGVDAMRKQTRINVSALREARQLLGRKHLTPQEWARVLQAAAVDPRDHAMLLVMYEAGLRASEPGRLRLTDARRLHEGYLYVYRGKGSRDGWLKLSSTTQRVLADWINLCYPKKTVRKASWWLFPGKRRYAKLKGMTPSGVFRAMRKIFEDAEVPKPLRHPHTIKHTRVQFLLEEAEKDPALGADRILRLIADIVGHRSAMTTLQHYMSQTGKERAFMERVTDETVRLPETTR